MWINHDQMNVDASKLEDENDDNDSDDDNDGEFTGNYFIFVQSNYAFQSSAK